MIKTYEAIFNEDDNIGVYGISLVKSPAMEGVFVALNKDEQIQFKEVDKEERKVVGLVLEPNKPIYRNNNGEEYNIIFREETIKNLAYNFFKKNFQKNSTIEHEDSKKIENVTFVESWIVEDTEKDKQNVYGFNYPVGSWLAVLKIDDDATWNNYVKTGKVKGFSIDGLLSLQEVKEEKNQLKDGTPITFNGVMFTKGDTLYLMNGEPLKTGKYELATEVEVDIIDGVVQSIKEINLKSIEMSKEVLEEAQKQTSILTELTSSIKMLFSSMKDGKNVKVEFGSVKSKDGSVTFEFDGDTMTPEGAIFVMTEDGQRVAVPVGEYELEDGSILVVEPEGIIKEVKSAQAPAPAQEEMNTNTSEISNDAKAVEEITNAIKSILIKYEAQEKEVGVLKTQLSKMVDESEDLRLLLSQTPARKPIKSQPVAVDLSSMTELEKRRYFKSHEG